MTQCLALGGMYFAYPHAESRDHMPPEVLRLLAAAPGTASDDAWAAFLARYSVLLLRVATRFAPGYDAALDRYAYMLDELRKGDCRRLRKFAADGRGRFSTWLTVVARRLCLDHYRREYGRPRSTVRAGSGRSLVRSVRRELRRLEPGLDELANLPGLTDPDPAEEMDNRKRRTLLRHAIGQLSPSDQLLLRLRFEQDLTAREMATILGLPSPFHVYRRLETVYSTLRAQLGSRDVAFAV